MKIPADVSVYVWIGLGLIGFFLLAQLMRHPKQILLRIFRTAVMGCLFVIAVDWIGQYFHYHLPFNPLTALTAGLLGIPGVLALITLQLWVFP